MRYIHHDDLGKKWSALTLGCWQLAPSNGWGDVCGAADAEAVIKTALECGITAFDTAEGYGDGESERRLGLALGAKKDDVIVISKIWPDAELTFAAWRERLENSLRALNRDYVDVYLVHWPGDFFDSPEKSQKMGEIMFRLKALGKTRLLGLSNFRAPDLERLGEGIQRFAVNQVPYSLLDRRYEDRTLTLCQEAGVQYMPYSPTGKGLLAGRIDDAARQFRARQHDDFYEPRLFPRAVELYGTVKAVAAEAGQPAVCVALAWALAQKNILTVATGTRQPAQVREFAPAGGLRLSPEHLLRLTEASGAFHRFKAGGG